MTATHRPTPPEFYEGQIAYWEDRPETDNPYLKIGDGSRPKEEWHQQAQDWDDGWCDAAAQEGEI